MKNPVLLLVSAISIAWAGLQQAAAKPNHTTKYVYYSVRGDTLESIYVNLVKRGPRVEGIKAYASTLAESSQSRRILPGKTCQIEEYNLEFVFTIKLPKLKNENALQGQSKALWKNFSTFLKSHEETHRSIWLECGAKLEAKVHAIKVKSCDEFDAQTLKLWKESYDSCAKRQDAFDVAERKRLQRHPFIVNVLTNRNKSARALKLLKKQ